MTIARLGLKVRVIGQGQRSTFSAYGRGNAVTRSVWPRSWIEHSFSSSKAVFAWSTESITQLSGGECLPPYARTVGHVTSVPYNDSTYKDIARYYYYYPQCSPDVIAAHGLHQQHHHHHHHQQQQQQQQPVLVHSHDAGGGVVYQAQADKNGGDGVDTTPTGRAGDGYGEQAVAAPSTLRYYAKSPSAGPGLVVDGCHRPMTAPVSGWTPTDHGQFYRTDSRLHTPCAVVITSMLTAVFHANHIACTAWYAPYCYIRSSVICLYWTPS